MSLIWADGFDHWGSTDNALNCYARVGNLINAAGTPRTGPYCASGNWARILSAAKDEIYVGIAFRLEGLPGVVYNNVLVGLNYNSANTPSGGYISANNQRGLQLCTGGDTVLLSSPNNIWAQGLWNYLEVYFKTNGAGTKKIEVRLNGTTVMKSDDLPAMTGGPITSIGFHSAFGGSVTQYLDDFWINDTAGAINNGFIGDRRMRTLLANADALPQQWLPNTGTTGYTQIDDVPAAGNYIQATAPGQVSKFEFGPDLPANTANIAGLVCFQRSVKSDAGSGTLTVGVENANGTITGSAKNPVLTVGYGINPDVFELDGGGFYWDYNTVNNSKFVLSRTA